MERGGGGLECAVAAVVEKSVNGYLTVASRSVVVVNLPSHLSLLSSISLPLSLFFFFLQFVRRWSCILLARGSHTRVGWTRSSQTV